MADVRLERKESLSREEDGAPSVSGVASARA
jgi:hypothetical protein